MDYRETLNLPQTAFKMKANLTQREPVTLKRWEKEYTHLEVALEMLHRGFTFLPPDLYKSKDCTYIPEGDGCLRLPFSSVGGLGQTVAETVVAARETAPFRTIDELTERTKLNTANINALKELGTLAGLPQSDQLTLFDL